MAPDLSQTEGIGLNVAGFQGTAIQGGPASMPVARARAFKKARRHSRWVRFAKIAIPVGSLLAMGTVGLFVYYKPFEQVENLSFGAIGVSGTNVTMEAPKLTGFKNDNRPYEVTASAATQDVRNPNFVELKDLRARIVTDDKGSAARLEANIGILDTQKERIDLRQNVRVRTDAGQEVHMRSALVDFKGGTVVSNEPVTVILGGNGQIEAKGVRVTDNGKVMSFKGRVHTTFLPASGSDSPSAADSEADQPASVDP